MPGTLEGKVAIVTGAGRGLGRAEALELAREGARVVVNDLGTSLAGEREESHADEVVAEIRADGGEAVAHHGDVASWDDARSMVALAVDTFGALDILVNNAGFLRDRMIFNMSEDDFDAVVRVHLKGHFATMRHAAEHWRARSKAADAPVYARLVSTTSESALLGGAGQPNYAAAKAGITALTLVAANSLERFGVRANVVAPRARTRMTEELPGFAAGVDEATGFDQLAPENVSPLVAWLASPAAERVTGQAFIVWGRDISVLHGPFVERQFSTADRWTPAEVAAQLTPFYEGRTPLRQGFVLQPDPRG